MSELSCLKWKCRRGTRELDLLLARYLEQEYPKSSIVSRSAFTELLDLQDPELGDLILHGRDPDNPAFKHVVRQLRQYR